MGEERVAPARPPAWLVPGVTAIAFLRYVTSLRSGIGFGDSGELVAAAIELGVPHPPGYPVWTLLAHWCTLLPGPDPAVKIAVASAVCMALAAGGIAWLLWNAIQLDAAREATLARSALAAGGALIFAFSTEAYSAAIETEVYALHILLAVALWIRVFQWGKGFLPRLMAFAAGLVLGLGLANHQTLLLAAPGYLVFVLVWDWRRALRPACVGLAVLGLVLGLSAYGLLPLWSARNPVVDWSDTETWNGFWAHLTRQQYRSLGLRSDWDTVLAQFRFFGAWLVREYAGLLVAGALATVVAARRITGRGRAWAWGHLVAFAGSGLFFTYIANTELDNSNREILSVYFMLPGLSAILLGVSAIGWWLETEHGNRERHAPIVAGVVLALAVYQAVAVGGRVSRLGDRLGEIFVGEITRPLPEDTVVVAGTGAVLFGTLYARVTGLRPDLVGVSFNRLASIEYQAEVNNQRPGLTWPPEEAYVAAFAQVAPRGATAVYGAGRLAVANGYLLGTLLAANPGRPMAYDEGIPVPWIYGRSVPDGMLLRLTRVPVDAVDPAVAARDRAYWDTLTSRVEGARGWRTDFAARQAFSRRRSTIGAWYAWHRDWAGAEYALQQALDLSGDNVDASAKLAMVNAAQGRVARGEAILQAALDRDPHNRTLRKLLEEYRAGEARWYGNPR